MINLVLSGAGDIAKLPHDYFTHDKERCLIGAGAVIMKDTVAKGVYLPKQGAMLFTKNSDEVEL